MRVVTTTIMSDSEFDELALQLGIKGYEFVSFMEVNNGTSWNFFVDEKDVEWARRNEAQIISKPVSWSNYVNSVLALLVGKGVLSGENFCITVDW